ncbi:conserved hypothetical protein [Culex quinquefasciatus]|uniref:Uncharacterized protein n=1 Tax=Culex quinquefasciatus TaxID=7176 RepID=B0X243_CULQU|nr:conserved hypothetical protein [Culex quinquefasciatus]|eukprot:XP_001863715.1 conserved hypothetical protein [Culex quinquefasciatus]
MEKQMVTLIELLLIWSTFSGVRLAGFEQQQQLCIWEMYPNMKIDASHGVFCCWPKSVHRSNPFRIITGEMFRRLYLRPRGGGGKFSQGSHAWDDDIEFGTVHRCRQHLHNEVGDVDPFYAGKYWFVLRNDEHTTLTVDGVSQSRTSRGKEFLFGKFATNSDVFVGGMPNW